MLGLVVVTLGAAAAVVLGERLLSVNSDGLNIILAALDKISLVSSIIAPFKLTILVFSGDMVLIFITP